MINHFIQPLIQQRHWMAEKGSEFLTSVASESARIVRGHAKKLLQRISQEPTSQVPFFKGKFRYIICSFGSNNKTMRNYKITCNLNDFAYCKANYENFIKELWLWRAFWLYSLNSSASMHFCTPWERTFLFFYLQWRGERDTDHRKELG